MARVSLSTDRVRHFVKDELMPLLLGLGSTAALCKQLNAALADLGEGGTVHPNRIHALLSDDDSRGVNEATLALVEKAVAACHAANDDWKNQSEQRLDELRERADHIRTTRGFDDEMIARQLALPPALARQVLSGESPARATAPDPIAGLPRSAVNRTEQPDWSFQDVAISRTLDAFLQRPDSKVGLVLPTGAGKTRTALRIVLALLDQSRESASLVHWVTHRRNLRTQARRELQRLLTTAADQIPEDSAALLANRIRFVMVGELPRILAPQAEPPRLIVVDEAHHAAAASYQPIFEATYPVPGLFLTATPNRADNLAIGIDEIAFTITHRELETRRVLHVPTFEDFPVNEFEWRPGQVSDLADFVINEAYGRFTKVLVLAPRIDRVREFYEALVEALAPHRYHPLGLDDIGYIHGSGNSLHCDPDDFLALFAEKPRAILVSAQLLLEGFDDPAINTVILTYPSSSKVRLMQAAGRCVRYSPGKDNAYVIQARNDSLAYHFDQRWLYQEISDFLRPELVDINYTSATDLCQHVREILQNHRVEPAETARILDRLNTLTPGTTCRILLHGFPYFGDIEEFETQAPWGALLETHENSDAFRAVFNAFCAQGASLSDPTDFLTREAARFGIPKDITHGSFWHTLLLVLIACYFAYQELHGAGAMAQASRPSTRTGPTTWLRYYTFQYRPALPSRLEEFLYDCYNRETVAAEFLADPASVALAIKIPLPLGGCEAVLFDPHTASDFSACVTNLRDRLSRVDPADQFAELAAFIAVAGYAHLPSRVLLRIQPFLGLTTYNTLVLPLT